MSTTPYEREILTHYHVAGDPPAQWPPERRNAEYWRIVQRAVNRGLIRWDGNTDTLVGTPLLTQYMVRLSEVEVPCLQW
jgi:hypothetical protein